MDISLSDMTARWLRTTAWWGAPEASRRAVVEELLGRYGEPHRRYHTAEHLAEVLTALDAPDRFIAVEVAAWFHDAVYDARAPAGANERASAQLAARLLRPLGAPDDTVAEAGRLIELTAGHAVAPGDVPGGVLADADLWILGSPASRYQRYAADVRAEYDHLSDDEWRAGRSAVVVRFAARPRIYVTEPAHRALDAPARSNLAWELAALGRGQAQP